MIAGLSNAVRGASLAAARFDRAAQQVATSATEATTAEGADAGAVAEAVGVGLPEAMVQMATQRFALLASLRAAASTNAMVAEAVALGGYGAGPEAAMDRRG